MQLYCGLLMRRFELLKSAATVMCETGNFVQSSHWLWYFVAVARSGGVGFTQMYQCQAAVSATLVVSQSQSGYLQAQIAV